MATQLLPTPGAVAPVMEPTTGADVAPVADDAAELSHQLRPGDPWRRVETQLGALTTALLHLVAFVTPIAVGGSPTVDRTEVDKQRTGDSALERPPLGDMAAIPGRVETAAISQFPPTTRATFAILTTAEESGASAAGSLLPRAGIRRASRHPLRSRASNTVDACPTCMSSWQLAASRPSPTEAL
ncbi:unnamed protein product [Lampetra fluviatilis]